MPKTTPNTYKIHPPLRLSASSLRLTALFLRLTSSSLRLTPSFLRLTPSFLRRQEPPKHPSGSPKTRATQSISTLVTALTLLFTLHIAHAQTTNSEPSENTDKAQDLYTEYKDVLYQIKIMDIESSQKSTIGSGFIIDKSGLAVTNYHVVSDYINSPSQYRIEVEDVNGEVSPASLVNFDVVNDLALIKIKSELPHNTYIPIAERLPQQGSTIYSLGNPHDLGMIVVPGTYNGLQQNTFYDRIHFTGSVNSGMSGGPVVNAKGQAMGVNVASAGNQLGFLVPLAPLQKLINNDTQKATQEQSDSKQSPLSTDMYKKVIAEQLTGNQSDLVASLTNEVWPHTTLGAASVPDALADFVNCWGGSNADDKDALYSSAFKSCAIDNTIFVSNRVKTGRFAMRFEWLSSTELNTLRFNSLVESQAFMLNYGDGSSIKDFTQYACKQTSMQNKHAIRFKASICVKAYQDFEALYDIVFVSTSLESPTQTIAKLQDGEHARLVSQFYISGISKESFDLFTTKFLDAISWQQ